jgi:DNA-binding transcriptional LysR family regulator
LRGKAVFFVQPKVFDRTIRRLELTKAGLPEAVASLSHAEDVLELARHHAASKINPVRIGFPPYITSIACSFPCCSAYSLFDNK